MTATAQPEPGRTGEAPPSSACSCPYWHLA